MNLLHVVSLAVIEGLTEFLPVSSTGHLVLVSNLMKLPQDEFTKTFEIFIQLGAILAVVYLYFHQLTKTTAIWPKIIASFIPTSIMGIIFYHQIKNVLLGSTSVVLVSLSVGAIVILIAENFLVGKKRHLVQLSQLSLFQAFVIGIFQSISLVPGVSRSAASIVGGLLVGLNRKSAVEYSFFIAIPTMFAATGLDLLKTGLNLTPHQYINLLTGFVISFATALVSIKFLLKIVKNYSLAPFALYRILLAVIYWKLVN